MEKFHRLAWVLCICLILQMLAVPAFAAETDTTEEETTEATEAPGAVIADVITEFGTAPIKEGCRTLEGQSPLGGSDKILSTARSAIIYEVNTGTIIYDYLPDEHVAPGGFAKLVTAMVALDRGQLADKVTVSTLNYKSLHGASNSKLKEGEILTLQDLLHCMLLTMTNDSALTIAEHIAGSESEFVKLMNEKAQTIGCTDTVFVNCHGLDAAGQHSTARDMVRVMQYALRDARITDLLGATSYDVPETNRSDKRKLTTMNYLLQQTNVTKFIKETVTGGIATYSAQTGASIFCTAESKGLSLIVVSIGSKRVFNEKRGTPDTYGNFEDAWTLLDFAFDNYKLCRLLHDGQSMVQFPVANGQNNVVAQTHAALDAILPKNARMDNLILKYSVANGGLSAPVAADQNIGTMQVWYRNSCLAETELYSMSEVRTADDKNLFIQSAASRNDSNVSGMVKTMVIVLLGLFTVYLVVNNVRRSIAMNRRRRRRASRRRSR